MRYSWLAEGCLDGSSRMVGQRVPFLKKVLVSSLAVVHCYLQFLLLDGSLL